jgi:uncharacterized paraquat-inducible protein A
MEGLLLAAKTALEFIQSIDGYENSVTAVNLRREIEAVEQKRAADGARFCPECHALLEEHSVYCDTCGTDTPRR